MIELPFRILDPVGRIPAPAYDGDAGLDLCSVEAHAIEPGARVLVRVGLAVEIPRGHAGLVLPRSGLAARHGITILNAPGLVDSGYRGELMVALHNTDRTQPFAVAVGDRIAQLVIVAIPEVVPVAADVLAASQRGTAGFGSSGLR